MYLSDIFTVSVNLAGVPGISIPCGGSKAGLAPVDAKGLPIGLQIIGKAFDEKNVLQVAHFLETSLA
jgi:aspartyl-tRNA(Asn)/glutamyl-tRNA(Gln) amidotransferase subunit A